MQTTATTQVTSDISSEPVGKAEKRKKWKLVASGDTRENCTYPLDDPHHSHCKGLRTYPDMDISQQKSHQRGL